jgi:uncharacterized membrane protein YbhN (UPF0104 family)
MLTPLEAHLACVLLFAGDLIARALRLRWYLHGLGHRVSFGEALECNAWGDAAAGLTPMRFGGELAKFARLVRARVPAPRAVLALGLEVIVTYPLVALFGGWLAWRFAPAWWDQARPTLLTALAGRWPWAAAVAVLTLLVGLGTWWRRKDEAGTDPIEPLSARSLPAWPLLAAIPLSLFNIVARTLMLPLLALTLPVHPELGIMALGSFVLLYSQLILPTPAGAGAVDLAFLAGMAGDLGAENTGLLVAWRFYTVGAGALFGAALALRTLGARPLTRVVSRVVGRSRPA